MASNLDVRFIANRLSSEHQGYDLIATKMAASGHGSHQGYREEDAGVRFPAAIASRLPWWKGLSRADAYHALLLWSGGFRPSPRLHHVVWGDALATSIRSRAPYTLTVHQPHEIWSKEFVESLPAAAGVVVVADREREKLKELFPNLPVRCVRNPVNTDFFKPAAAVPLGRKVIVAAGKHLRNHAMLARVAARLIAQRDDVEFRVVLNPDFEWPEAVRTQIPKERFTTLHRLSAEALRDLYQSGWAACLPYNNVTASNSLCEAMACGLPIVTTDVGGMHTYGGGETMILTRNDDDDAMIRELNSLLDSPERRNEIGQRARTYAETHLAWPVVLRELETFLDDVKRAAGRT